MNNAYRKGKKFLMLNRMKNLCRLKKNDVMNIF